MNEPTLADRTTAAFRWSAFTTIAEALLSLGILTVLARLLTPRDFGVIAIAMIFIRVAGTLGKLGIGPAIIQRADLTQRHIVTGFTLSALFGVLFTVTMWLAAPATSGFFAEPEVPAILGMLSAIFAIVGVGVISEHLLRRRLHFRQLMVAEILSLTAGYGLVAIAMAILGYGVWSLAGGLVARHAVFAAVVVAYRPPPLRLGLGRRESFDLLRFGTGLSSCALLDAVGTQGSRFVIGSGLGAISLGYFTQALRVASVPTRLSLRLTRVLFPAMAERQQQIDRIGTIYLYGIEMMSLLAIPTSVLTAICAPEIIGLLLGKQWDAAVPILQILATGIVFHVCNLVNLPAVRALHAVYREAWRRMLYTILVILGVWLGLRWGLAGVAVAIIGSRIVLHLLLSQLTLKLLGLRWLRLLQCHVPALWTGTLTAAVLWPAVEFARGAGLPAAATLIIGLVVSGAIAAVAIYSAPAPMRPPCIPWSLGYLPFTKLGTAGRVLQFVLKCLDRNPHALASATKTGSSK